MKKIAILLISILILSGCKKEEKKDPLVFDGKNIIVYEKSECKNELKDYYEYENKKIKLLCIEEIKLTTNLTTETLDYYIENNDLSI